MDSSVIMKVDIGLYVGTILRALLKPLSRMTARLAYGLALYRCTTGPFILVQAMKRVSLTKWLHFGNTS